MKLTFHARRCGRETWEIIAKNGKEKMVATVNDAKAAHNLVKILNRRD